MPESNEGYDPLGKDVHTALLITNMKIYDVLMAILSKEQPAVARQLDELHTNGIVLGLGPQFSHFFDRNYEELPEVEEVEDEDTL